MKNERDRRNADRKREILNHYKIAVGCVDCGYNAHPWALEFDHKEPRQGKTIGSMMYSAWKLIWEEVWKCDVVCCNCHAIRTYTRKSCPSGQMAKALASEARDSVGSTPTLGTQ